MPTLFISYKRGTAAVAPLMERLKAAHYRLWFDRDDIHMGDPDWQQKIDQGLAHCDGVILCMTPTACTSGPVQYEIKKARELGKPIFPCILEKMDNWGERIKEIGLPERQHLEDFTDVEDWDKKIKDLLRDLEHQGLRGTRHDRNNPNYVLRQQYLKQLVERIGTLNLAQINPDQSAGAFLEAVYVDLPTDLSISVNIQNRQGIKWEIIGAVGRNRKARADDIASQRRDDQQYTPETLGYEREPLECLLSRIDSQNGINRNVLPIYLTHLTAACPRLVILGAPGSGKSTIVKYLALCLAGEQIEGWTRKANIAQLGNWTHGALIPIYVELRRFVASVYFPQKIHELPTAAHLLAYISDGLGAYADDIRYDLEHGLAVLILDGLDEVPYPEGLLKARQTQLIALAQSLNIIYNRSRIIVTSRPYAYEGWTLPGFTTVTVTDFKDQHRKELATRLYQVTGLNEESAKIKAAALTNQLAPVDSALKDRPLFLTLMATIFLHGGDEGLPTRRGTLYRQSILLLLDRWTQGKPNAPSLREILGDKTPKDLYNQLAALAYDVHHSYGDKPGTPEIEYEQIIKHLKPLGKHTAVDLVSYLSENAGILISPGQNEDYDVFHFAHRTFQEYLAAEHLAATCLSADSFAQVRELMLEKPQVWRFPCTLVGDVLADTGRKSELWTLIGDLLEDAPPEKGDDMRWLLAWLAATIAQEQKLYKQSKLNRRTEQLVRNVLVEWLVMLIETPLALDPVERADCGRKLGLLGDPRPGVGIDEKTGLPDILWCDIPAGKFLMGDYKLINNPRREVEIPYNFKISKYPITMAQFQAFIEAQDGYENKVWWEDMLLEENIAKKNAPDLDIAFWSNLMLMDLHDQAFQFSNHPRENVSWYQAVAFTRWLSYRLQISGLMIRLPTQEEWEYAARGSDGRQYPYEGKFDAAKGNTRKTGIKQTSAVGLFPLGASPFNVMDMIGNVRQWCLNKYDKPDVLVVDNSHNMRVHRGGSWDSEEHDVSSSCCKGATPTQSESNYGFRVVAVPVTIVS